MTPELVLLPAVAYRGREIPGRRLGDLLALLAADLRTGCSAGRLAEGLWPDGGPEHPGKALQILVSRARAQLGAAAIASTPTGYRLALAADAVDAAQLRQAATAVTAAGGDPAGVLAAADAALALWDGQVDGDGPLRDLRAGCVPAREAVARARAIALARLGRRAEALPALAELAAAQPRDEEVLAHLLRAEAAERGPAAALDRFEEYRRRLRDELGADPGPAVRAVHAELLRADAPVVRDGVAHEPNPLVGRDADVAAVADLLRRARVVSIVGPGGLGKTRLAHAVARAAPQRVVRFVGLAGVARDEDVLAALASDVAAPPGPRGVADPLTRVVDALDGALLVLDNCEHVLEGTADLVSALVARSRELRVLTTSRAPLGLTSEAVHLLPPLGPATAAELFRQRAHAARPDAQLPPDAVASLCARLDGLPLAIELAAARVRSLTVREIAERMDDRFAVLRAGALRGVPERHRTLHAVVDWSWALLSPPDRDALAVLSLFAGGFSAAAAEHVGAAEALDRLVEHSLVAVDDTPDGARYRMLETVRDFAARHRTDALDDRFLDWARQACRVQVDLVGPRPYDAVAFARAEQDNLLQALRLAERRGDDATLAATAAVLLGLWSVENSFGRVISLTAEIGHRFSHLRPGPDLVEAVRTVAVLDAVNRLALLGTRASRGLVVLRRLPPAPPDTPVRAMGLVLTRPPEELPALADSDDGFVAGFANAMLTYVHESEGRLDAAFAAARRMVVLDRLHPLLAVMAHSRVGELLLRFERGAEAAESFRTAADLYRRLNPVDTIGLRWALVQALLQAGRVEEAERRLDEDSAAGADESYGALTASIALRAELALLRGDVGEGLALWRRAVAAFVLEPSYPVVEALPDAWGSELRAAAVVAHARNGRLDLVPELVEQLPRDLADLLDHPVPTPMPSYSEPAVCGALLLGIAAADLARGGRARAVRMIALAERFGFPHNFHPTMASARARADAEAADPVAYREAVAAYAGLDEAGLRAQARALLGQRIGSRA